MSSNWVCDEKDMEWVGLEKKTRNKLAKKGMVSRGGGEKGGGGGS